MQHLAIMSNSYQPEMSLYTTVVLVRYLSNLVSSKVQTAAVVDFITTWIMTLQRLLKFSENLLFILSTQMLIAEETEVVNVVRFPKLFI